MPEARSRVARVRLRTSYVHRSRASGTGTGTPRGLRHLRVATRSNSGWARFIGSPTKVFEYMAMGHAIVASELEQIGEVLEHDHTAYLVPPGDTRELALGLSKLLDDPGLRSRLGAAARWKHSPGTRGLLTRGASSNDWSRPVADRQRLRRWVARGVSSPPRQGAGPRLTGLRVRHHAAPKRWTHRELLDVGAATNPLGRRLEAPSVQVLRSRRERMNSLVDEYLPTGSISSGRAGWRCAMRLGRPPDSRGAPMIRTHAIDRRERLQPSGVRGDPRADTRVIRADRLATRLQVWVSVE